MAGLAHNGGMRIPGPRSIFFCALLAPFGAAAAPSVPAPDPCDLSGQVVEQTHTFNLNGDAYAGHFGPQLLVRELMPGPGRVSAFPTSLVEVHAQGRTRYKHCGGKFSHLDVGPTLLAREPIRFSFQTVAGPSPGELELVVVARSGADWTEILSLRRTRKHLFAWQDLDKDGELELVEERPNAVPVIRRFDGQAYIEDTWRYRDALKGMLVAHQQGPLNKLVLAYALRDEAAFKAAVQGACPDEAVLKLEPRRAAESFLARFGAEPSAQDLEAFSKRPRSWDDENLSRVDPYVYHWVLWGLRELGKGAGLLEPLDLGDQTYGHLWDAWWFGPCVNE